MKRRTDGYREETWTNAAGAIHRDGSPAEVLYDPDGAVVREHYYAYGERFRADGPADLYYDAKTGTVKKETYRTGAKGYVHRSDGPAEVEYYRGGGVQREFWADNGRRRRWLGPSEVNYAPDGSVESTFYSTDGWSPCPLDELADELRAHPEDELREIIRASNYARFLDDHEPGRIVDAVADGLITEEGVELYLNRTPAEWIRAYETAGTHA